jgi:hypothetical protein
MGYFHGELWMWLAFSLGISMIGTETNVPWSGIPRVRPLITMKEPQMLVEMGLDAVIFLRFLRM